MHLTLYIIFRLLSGEFNARASRNISEGNQSAVSLSLYTDLKDAHSGARISTLCSHAGAASRASHSAIGSSHCSVSCRYVCTFSYLKKAYVQGVPVKHIEPRFREAN